MKRKVRLSSAKQTTSCCQGKAVCQILAKTTAKKKVRWKIAERDGNKEKENARRSKKKERKEDMRKSDYRKINGITSSAHSEEWKQRESSGNNSDGKKETESAFSS